MAIRKFSVVLAAAVLATGSAAISARASTVDLYDLINKANGSDGTILVGDKLFSGFSYSGTGDAAATINPKFINVIGIGSDPSTNPYGIEFQGDLEDLGVTLGGTDIDIKYTVTVTNPGFVITDMGLSSNIDSTGIAVGKIHEQITGSTPPTPVVIGVFDHNFNINDTSILLLDEKNFSLPGYTSLTIDKDISLNAAPGSDVTVSTIDQTFSETPTAGDPRPVPTPKAAWMGLSLIGGIGGVSMLRKRQRMS